MLGHDDLQMYELLLDICNRYGVDPSASFETEAFFQSLLKAYNSELEETQLETWLDEQIPRHFAALNDRPRWIQDAEWPLVNGKPMVFVGQVDISIQDSELASQMFHDDTSFYVFVGLKMPPVVVMQQY